MIARHPALVARCQGTADVIQALTFAHEYGLKLAVVGRGHNVAGHAVCDDGELWQAMHRFSPGSTYLNFPGFGEEREALVRNAYAEPALTPAD